MSESWLRGAVSSVTGLALRSARSRRRHGRRYWRLALAVLVLAGAAWQVSRTTEHWPIRGLDAPLLLIPGAIVGTVSYVAFAVAWARLRRRGESWVDIGGPWFGSLLARYAPGGVWQPAMRAIGHRLEGDDTGRELIRFLSEQALGCFSCATLALASAAIAPLSGVIAWVLLGFVVALPTMIYTCSRYMSSMSWTRSALGWTLVGHVLLATAVALFARTLIPLGPVELAAIGRDFLIAGVAGLLVPLVPAGLGVREVVFVWLSVPYITGADALTIALAARVALLGCEVLAYATWAAVSRGSAPHSRSDRA